MADGNTDWIDQISHGVGGLVGTLVFFFGVLARYLRAREAHVLERLEAVEGHLAERDGFDPPSTDRSGSVVGILRAVFTRNRDDD